MPHIFHCCNLNRSLDLQHVVKRKAPKIRGLADPYANSDESALPEVDEVIRVVCEVMLLDDDDDNNNNAEILEQKLAALSLEYTEDVISSLAYLHDRIGIPRDMPLATACQLRAYINKAIHTIYSKA